MIHLYKYILTFCIGFGMNQLAWAQTEEEVDGEVEDAEIVIEKERKVELKQQRKIYEFIKWKPEPSESSNEPVDFVLFDYKEDAKTIEVEPARVDNADSSLNYNHFIKAGYGNFGSPLLNLDLTKKFDPNQWVGVRLTHKSFAAGAVDDENSGSAATAARLYGTVVKESIILNSALDYRHERYFYYGYPVGSVVSSGDIRHTNHFLNLIVGMQGARLESPWKYSAKLNFNNYADNFNAREHIFGGDASVSFQQNFFLDLQFMLSKYKDTGIDQSRNSIRLKPYYRWVNEMFTLDVGFSVNAQNDNLPDLNQQKIFPYASLTYPINDQYSAFAKLDGGFTVNTLFALATEVGVLNQAVSLVNSERIMDLSGGINGSPMDKLSVKAALNFQSVRYLPILINNTTDQSRLDVLYDQEISKIFVILGEARYKLSDEHQLSLGAKIFNYSSDGYDQIYHRPTSELYLSGRHKLLPELQARWNFTALGGLISPGMVITDPEVSLGTVTKLDLEMHYQINENWGAFLSGENLFNQEYQRYMNYPQRGIQLKVGATFRL